MKEFSKKESDTLESIILHRRDVRGNRFQNTPIPEAALQKILLSAIHAPSVGYSQPWEFIMIKAEETKSQIREVFDTENEQGSDAFEGGSKKLYDEMKLEGITEAPVNLAVFYKPSESPVLGQTSMPEVGKYSVVCAIQNMWLMARSLNIGLGWVSILDADKVKKILNVPADRVLIGYLCLGYVDLFYDKPELETKKWNSRKLLEEVMHYEKFNNE